MGLLCLDAESCFGRWRQSGVRPRVLTLGESVRNGVVGFTVLSLAVFATWAFGGRFLYREFGELGAYGVWCVLFLLGAGCLRPSLTGPISWGRFYGMFLAGFLSYAAVWTLVWMLLHNRLAEWLGAFFGMLAMGVVFGWIFGHWKAVPKSILVLFGGNALGYFIGSWCHANTPAPWAQLLWGLFYGLGTGAGFGAALYFFQAPLRSLIETETPMEEETS